MRRWIILAVMGGFVAGAALALIATSNNRELLGGVLVGICLGAGPLALAWWDEEQP